MSWIILIVLVSIVVLLRAYLTIEISIIFVVVAFIVIKILLRGHRRKCDRCKKWFAMRKQGKECVDEKNSHTVKEGTMKNSKGEVIRRWDEFVPATVYTYHIHRKCKHCGHRDYLISHVTEEN
jgi:hypothetical protein